MLVAGCQDRPSETAEGPEVAPSVARRPGVSPAPSPAGLPSVPVEVGQHAPSFALLDSAGQQVRLADFKGKTVVLEWFNPECPFVRLSHTKGSLRGMAQHYADKPAIVWLAINSAGEGRQGFGAEKNESGKRTFGIDYPILMDTDGRVGHAYGATNTPHMFVISPSGDLVYAGAIDNSPDAEGQSPSDGKLVNYVEQALAELSSGKPISVQKTRAYGCSVKYAQD